MYGVSVTSLRLLLLLRIDVPLCDTAIVHQDVHDVRCQLAVDLSRHPPTPRVPEHDGFLHQHTTAMPSVPASPAFVIGCALARLRMQKA
jgi:hypothetical protein